jgi:hypothetical protein
LAEFKVDIAWPFRWAADSFHNHLLITDNTFVGEIEVLLHPCGPIIFFGLTEEWSCLAPLSTVSSDRCLMFFKDFL